MWYTLVIVLSLTGMNLPPIGFQKAALETRGDSVHREHGYEVKSTRPVSRVLAQNNQPSSTEKQRSDTAADDTRVPVKKGSAPGKQEQKKTPLKDFQPTEKIKADKAVDFPADI